MARRSRIGWLNLNDAIYILRREHPLFVQNWVPLLGRTEDRNGPSRQAGTEISSSGESSQPCWIAIPISKRVTVRSLTEVPLRRADVYDLDAGLSKSAPPVYTVSATTLSRSRFSARVPIDSRKSLLPLLDSQTLKCAASPPEPHLLVRDSRFGEGIVYQDPPAPT